MANLKEKRAKRRARNAAELSSSSVKLRTPFATYNTSDFRAWFARNIDPVEGRMLTGKNDSWTMFSNHDTREFKEWFARKVNSGKGQVRTGKNDSVFPIRKDLVKQNIDWLVDLPTTAINIPTSDTMQDMIESKESPSRSTGQCPTNLNDTILPTREELTKPEAECLALSPRKSTSIRSTNPRSDTTEASEVDFQSILSDEDETLKSEEDETNACGENPNKRTFNFFTQHRTRPNNRSITNLRRNKKKYYKMPLPQCPCKDPNYTGELGPRHKACRLAADLLSYAERQKEYEA